MSSPRVSVVMCTCNGERYLPMQIQTILGQDLEGLELVVVDDASTDGTWPLLEAWSSRDRRVRLHRNEVRLGVNENFARAFTLANAPLIAPADQDDLWAPNKLSRLLSALGDASAVYCDSEMIDDQGRSLGRRLSDIRRMYQGRDPLPFTLYNCVAGHALLFRRDLLAHLMPFAIGKVYDQWIALRATTVDGLRYLPEQLVRYRQHADAVTDILRARGRKPKSAANQLKGRLDDLWWLWSIAQVPGPRQSFLQKLYKASRLCTKGRMSPHAAWLLWRERELIFSCKYLTPRERLEKVRHYSRGFSSTAMASLDRGVLPPAGPPSIAASAHPIA